MYQYDERPRLTLYHATAFYSMKHQRLDCLEIRLWCQLSSIETCDLLIPFSHFCMTVVLTIIELEACLLYRKPLKIKMWT